MRGADALVANSRLFEALQAAFGVRFAAWNGATSRCDAVIVVGDDAVPSAAQAAVYGVPTLAVAGEAAAAASCDIKLGRDRAIDRRLHGIVLVDQPRAAVLDVTPGETVLADAPTGPAWTASGAGARVDRVSGPLPVLGER
ncbi:MAG: hypothetical protein ACRDMZ_19650, partial [Solirubrobacteraceae bacterium]